jgi:hypothetical protein
MNEPSLCFYYSEELPCGNVPLLEVSNDHGGSKSAEYKLEAGGIPRLQYVPEVYVKVQEVQDA